VWIQVLNALSYSMLLFLLAAGLTVTLGVLRIANLTHGSYYLIGAYVAITVVADTHSYVLGVLAALAVVGVLGFGTERGLMSRFVGNEPAQVLISFGLLFLFGDLCLAIWGGVPQTLPAPAGLQGAVRVGGLVFPSYRVVLLAAGALAALALWLLMDRTRIGLAVRAAVDDRDLAHAAGVNVRSLMTGVFTAGAMLAAAAGVLGGPILGAYQGADLDVLLLALVVVMIGGMGSLPGAFAGALIIGFVQTFGSVFFPQFSVVAIYLAMVLMIAVRPAGLFGRAVR
jgi:branched-chain amino acid transport system permease protein